MGSSREIAIGPVAVVSMLLSSTVTKVIDPVANPDAYRNRHILCRNLPSCIWNFQVMFSPCLESLKKNENLIDLKLYLCVKLFINPILNELDFNFLSFQIPDKGLILYLYV